MKVLLYACLLMAIVAKASDTGSPEQLDTTKESTTPFVKTLTRYVIKATPAVALFGKSFPGYLVRCSIENPGQCENFDIASSDIQALFISGEYIYAGLQSNHILRCRVNTKESCKSFYKGSDTVYCLTGGRGHLYAGLKDGYIIRCELHQLNCHPLHNMKTEVNSLMLLDKSIYVGKGEELMRCSVTVTNSCTLLYNMTSIIVGLARMRNNIYAVTSSGYLWNCTIDSSTTCYSVYLNESPAGWWEVTAFNNSLFMISYYSGISKWVNNSCVNYVNQSKAWSMAMAYSTYHMQSRYKDENTTCKWEGDSKCPRVIYYNEQERALLEVYVKDGRLYNSRDSLVDTSDADHGHVGPVAIFAMGPDGTILLSNLHKRGFIHTSSLYAGNPVSGAGEMIVKNGVIKKIIACSDHYKTDLNLNRQVIQSLLTQGYTDSIESVEC